MAQIEDRRDFMHVTGDKPCQSPIVSGLWGNHELSLAEFADLKGGSHSQNTEISVGSQLKVWLKLGKALK